MSRITYKRLGVALMGLAVPLALAAPTAAQAPGPEEVAAVVIACSDLGFDTSTCSQATVEGIYEVIEVGLGDIVDLGFEAGTEPGDFPYDINAIALNPLPPVIPVPPVPGVVYP